MIRPMTVESVRASQVINDIQDGIKIDLDATELKPYLVHVGYAGDFAHYLAMAARQLLCRYYQDEYQEQERILNV